MDVYLIRHSTAAPDSGGGDDARPLTTDGRRRFHGVAEFLKKHGVLIDQIVHSSKRRSIETADILADVCDVPDDSRFEVPWIGGRYTAEELAGEVGQRAGEAIAVVGHLPHIGMVASSFVGGCDFKCRPGTVIAIRFGSRIQPGAGELRWVIEPKWFD